MSVTIVAGKKMGYETPSKMVSTRDNMVGGRGGILLPCRCATTPHRRGQGPPHAPPTAPRVCHGGRAMDCDTNCCDIYHTMLQTVLRNVSSEHAPIESYMFALRSMLFWEFEAVCFSVWLLDIASQLAVMWLHAFNI